MNVLFFTEPGADDASKCGGKAASLGRLANVASVPPGFCITVDAYREWERSGASDVPAGLKEEIKQAYARLEDESGVPNLAVAVRSSAVDEDGKGDSFAGLHDTYLNITGADAVIAATVDCWASLKNERAQDYRRSRGLDIESAVMGVAVQQLVFADVSAVAFSANPVTGNREEVLINANYGLGEAVVSGATTPDTIVVDKSGMAVSQMSIGSKEVMTVRTSDGTTEKSTPRVMRDLPVLKDPQVTEIAELAVQLEQHHGWPIDLECAIKGDDLYLLQCRPVTTL